MSQSAADLEGELGIPSNANLDTPSHLSRPVQLLLIPPQDIDTSYISIASPSKPNPEDQVYSGSFSTHLSADSSIRGTAAKCLVVGRQASVADIRLDHKSVSRRHTALYYKHQEEGIDNGASASEASSVLVVHDLGGKKGTFVNDTRLEANGTVELPLMQLVGGEKNVHRIRFGNAPLICKVILPEGNNNSRDEKPPQQESNEQCQEKEVLLGQSKDDATIHNASSDANKMETEDDVPSTRESREAQIAAMVASMDTNPVYKKYNNAAYDDDNMETMNKWTAAAAGSNSNDTKISNNNNIHTNSITNNKYNLPISSSITLAPGSSSFASSDGTGTSLQANSSVSTLCFEPSGARVVAGHRDGTLRFYDFHGMQPSSDDSNKVTFPPFRIVDTDNDPLDQTGRHILTALGSSATGGSWIVGTTSAQAKVIDREGRSTLFYFIKGDTYVTDSSANKGHTASVSGVAFHPLVKDVCWTCGLDGSIRQWDVSGRGKTIFKKLVCQKVVGKCKNEKGQRTQIVSNLSVHPNGRKMVVGTSCGSIQIWNCFGSAVNSRPLGAVYSAHGVTKPVTFVTFSGNGDRIASRSEADNTVRIWDANRMEKGTGSFGRKHSSRGKEGEHSSSLLLAICNGLPALNEFANCAFGPNGKMLCAGTAVDPRASNTCGTIKFYELPEEVKRSKGSSKESGSKSSSKNKATAILDPVEEVEVAPNASVLSVQWHTKLNQIAVGASNGM